MKVGCSRAILHEAKNINSACTGPGKGELETVHHIVLECKRLSPTTLNGESELARTLGFAMEDGLMNLVTITQPKQKLGKWWNKSREG